MAYEVTSQNDPQREYSTTRDRCHTSLVTLKTELEQFSTVTDQNAWMRRLMEVVENNHNGRIPRGGWEQITIVFSRQFGTKTSQECKTIYNNVKYQSKQPDRQPINNNSPEELIIARAQGIVIKNPSKFKKIQELLHNHINDAKNPTVQRKSCRKYSSSQTDWEAIEYLNIILE